MSSLTGYPSLPQYRLLNPRTGEIFLVTDVVGSTLTVTRGAEGTTAAAILGGDVLAHILTAGALYSITNSMRVVATPPSLVIEFFSQQSPATYPPTSDSLITGRGIETRTGMPNYTSAVIPPSGYPVVANFTVQMRARFVCPIGLGGTWTFAYTSDDGADISVWNDAFFTSQVGSTIGLLTWSSSGSASGNVTLTAGNTYYLRVRWGQGAGQYGCFVTYVVPGGATRYLTDGQTVSGVYYDSPFRAVGGLLVTGDTRPGDRLDLLTGAGAVSAVAKIGQTSGDAQFVLSSPPFTGSLRLVESDGTVINTVQGPFNGGEVVRVGGRS